MSCNGSDRDITFTFEEVYSIGLFIATLKTELVASIPI